MVRISCTINGGGRPAGGFRLALGAFYSISLALLAVFAIAAIGPKDANAAPQFSLQVTLAGTGSGTVVSEPAGINCHTGDPGGSAGCLVEFEAGAFIQLDPTPDKGHVFTGWTGASVPPHCLTITFDHPKRCSLRIQSNVALIANFAEFDPANPPLSVFKGGSGTGTITSSPAGVNCGPACDTQTTNFPWGTSVTLTATPVEGAVFVGWGGRGACVEAGSSPTCTFTMGTVGMGEARSVFPVFNVRRHALTVELKGDGLGKVTSDPAGIDCGSACLADFNHGEQVTLTAAPDSGQTFEGWSGACTGSSFTCEVTMDQARTAIANFSGGGAVQHYMEVFLSGDGSGEIVSSPAGINCVSGSGDNCRTNFDHNTRVALTATPNAGSVFAGWSGDMAGACRQVVPSENSVCTLTMDQSRNVAANFADISHVNTSPLTVLPDGDGAGNVMSSPDGINCGSTGFVCSAQFGKSETVTLTASAETGSLFAGWSGACQGSALSCTVTMEQARTVRAIFTATFPGFEVLTVIRTGDGYGRVTSRPGWISCGDICASLFPEGQMVTLNAAPETGSVFTGWNGACQGSGTTCVVKLAKTATVWASFSSFDPNDPGAKPPLVVFRTGDGAGRVSSNPAGIDCGNQCDARFERDQTVTLTAQPANGSVFAGWNGACQDGRSTCEVKMSKARSVWASFSVDDPVNPRLTVFRIGDGAGTVTSDPAGIDCGSRCTAPFERDRMVTLTAVPDGESLFTGWNGSCQGTGDTCVVNMSKARSAWASFSVNDPDRPRLNVFRVGEGEGTVTTSPAGVDCGNDCQAAFNRGQTVTLIATPKAGSVFTGWSGAGCAGAGNCTVTMNQALSVWAVFSPASDSPGSTRQLIVVKTGNGAGTVKSDPAGIGCGSDCIADFTDGAKVTLTAEAATGSVFAGWTGACDGNTPTCEVSMDKALLVGANFRIYDVTAPPLTVFKAGNGGGTVNSTPAGIDCGAGCVAEFQNGSTVTLTATPDSSSEFTGWSGACSGTAATCQVVMTEARAVTATFAVKKVTPVPPNPPDGNTAIYDPATGKLKIRLKCASHYRPKCIRMVAWGVSGKKKKAKQLTNRLTVKNRKAGKWKYATLTVKPKYRQKVEKMGKLPHKTLWVRIKLTFKKTKRVKIRQNGKVRRVKRKVKSTRTIHHHYRILVRR